MALLISNSKFQNTNVNVDSYVRVEFFAFKNGQTMNIRLFSYESKEQFDLGKEILTDIPGILVVNILAEEKQDLLTAHNYAKTELEAKGFEVTILL